MTDERERPCQAPALPDGLARLVEGYAWHRDLVGEAGCDVWRLDRPGAPGLYLKSGAGDRADEVLAEAAKLRWLAASMPVPAVRALAFEDGRTSLLSEALPGRTAYQILEAEPGRRQAIVDALAETMRRLHVIVPETCQFEAGHAHRLAKARARLAAGLIDEDDFGDDHAGWSAAQVVATMEGLLPIAAERVVVHGDFSLDNLIVAPNGTIGLIDVGGAGLADRYQDIAILWDCLGEFGDGALRDRFLAGYGIAAPDERRLRFHLLLDECF